MPSSQKKEAYLILNVNKSREAQVCVFFKSDQEILIH